MSKAHGPAFPTALLLLSAALARAAGADTLIPNPVLFVTQVPIPGDFTAATSVFGNHQPDLQSTGRGGDLYIRYPDGILKNLTQLAGYGVASGFQGATSIAVREPSVHWSGTKALFSMVIGAPTQQYHWETYYWQIYEVTGLGENESPVITKVAHQPPSYNNVSPIYGTDERIIFTSDRPRDGQAHLYPQRDEYEEAPTVVGLYSLDPASGDLKLLNHVPSGVFSPSIDSFGRLLFIRWDHLQRDQQADADAVAGGTNGTFNWSDESPAATALNVRDEVFPEPRAQRTDLLAGTDMLGLEFNQFFPWAMNEDGTTEETINHVGRHEIHGYFAKDVTDDGNVVDFNGVYQGRANTHSLTNFLQLKEDPTSPGRYWGVDAPEFTTHAAGQVVSMTAPPSTSANLITVAYGTARSTATYTTGSVPADDTGHYRDPLPMSDGTLVAAHTFETRQDANDGTTANPVSRYAFRLRTLTSSGGVLVPGTLLTSGISKSVSWFDPDTLVSYSTNLWELEPVEVKARTKPTPTTSGLSGPEANVFAEEGVDPAEFQRFMRDNSLSTIVSRNMTTRDAADRQQPFNLHVAGSGTQTVGTQTGPPIYDIAHFQMLQGDLIRGLGGTATPKPGRRVIAQYLHDPKAQNPPDPSGPAGSVAVGSDGSMAAFVPSHRAMTWQLTDGNGKPVVRERYWLTFQPGEIRVCTSCHGLNAHDQAGNSVPTNEPEALHTLLQFWKAHRRGDANGDGNLDVSDVFYLVNALFAGGPAAVGVGDVNGDGKIDAADVFYLINYLFAAGASPPV
jgi:Hydrazine synthase alpha subunit middle domain/Dockerin type I domain